MNTADLIMCFESITSLSQEIKLVQKEYSELLVNLDSLVENVNGKWSGKAQVEFATAYSKLKPKLEVISGVLENYATALSAAAKNEADLEKHHENMLYNVGIPSF